MLSFVNIVNTEDLTYETDHALDIGNRTQMGINEYDQLMFILQNPRARERSISLFGSPNIYFSYSVKHPYEKNRLETMSAYNISKSHDLKYKTKMKNHARSGEHILIAIEETVRGNRTFGGSNFRVEMRGYENVVCSTQDYRNGSYRVRCPVLSYCAFITVQVMYLNYDAFVVKHQITLDLLIYKRRWCPSTVGAFVGSQKCSASVTPPSGRGRWRRNNQNWTWYENGCPVVFPDTSSIKQCLNKFHAIHLVGDSHVRYMSFAIISHFMTITNKFTGIKWNDYNAGNVHFWWTKTADHAAKNLDTLRVKYKRKKEWKEVVLVSSGAWDMMLFGPKHYMDNAERTMFKSIRQLKQHPAWSGVPILFMNNVAFPPKHTLERFEIGFRSIFNIAAVNYWLNIRLNKLDVPVIDALSVINMRYDENVCGNHYLCLKPGESPKKQSRSRKYVPVSKNPVSNPHITGTVGFTLADIVLTNICAL